MSFFRAARAWLSTVKVGWPLGLVLVAATAAGGILLSLQWTASDAPPVLAKAAARSRAVPLSAAAASAPTDEPVVLGRVDPFAPLRPSPPAALGLAGEPPRPPAEPASGPVQPLESEFAHLSYWGRLRSDGEWTYLLSTTPTGTPAPAREGTGVMRVRIGSTVGTSYEVTKVDGSGLQLLDRSNGSTKTIPWETGSP